MNILKAREFDEVFCTDVICFVYNKCSEGMFIELRFDAFAPGVGDIFTPLEWKSTTKFVAIWR